MKKTWFLFIIIGILLVNYFVFFRVDWNLIEKGDVKKIERHLKFKSKVALNSTNKEGYALFNVVLKATANSNNINLVKFLLSKDLNTKKMISPYESLVDGLGQMDDGKLHKIVTLGLIFKGAGINDFKGDRSLLKALEKGEYKLFETLLKAGVNVNQRNALGETSVFYIIKEQYKYEEELENAMEKVGIKEIPNKATLAKLFIRDDKELLNSELMIIKRAMDFYEKPLAMLDILNRYKADPNIPNIDGVSPAAYVFDKKNKIYLNKLLTFKTKVNFNEYANYKVIFDGILRNDKVILKQLYEGKINLFQKNEKSETLLNFLIREEKYDVLSQLVERKILNDEYKKYIFDYYLKEEDMKPLKKLNELGVYINNPQEIFIEKLNKYKKIDIVVYLIDIGVDINYKNKLGETPLIYSVKKMDETLFRLLLLRGADINLQDLEGNTALMVAIKNKNTDFVIELINRGAKLDVTNIKGETALNLAKGNQEILNILKSKVNNK